MSSDDTNYAAPNADGIDLSLLYLVLWTVIAIRSCRLALSAFAPSAYGSKSEMHLALSEDEIVVDLSADEVAIIFSFLPPKSIMRARVCKTKTWRDAAKETIVPLTDFIVHGTKSYNAMRVMSTALPNLQQLKLGPLCTIVRRKYTDGEEPDERRAALTSNFHTYDINIVSNFRKLRILKLQNTPPMGSYPPLKVRPPSVLKVRYPAPALNGRYPFLFDFPLLEQLIIRDCDPLKLDLEMLSGLPLLKELDCTYMLYLTGNLSSLRVLKNTLEKVVMFQCPNIRGNFMELADFPHLKELNLQGTRVTGDIRDIRTDDFPAIERLILPSSVVGGVDHEFQRISEVPTFMQSIHHLLKRSPSLFNNALDSASGCKAWMLSRASPDWYNEFFIEMIPTPRSKWQSSEQDHVLDGAGILLIKSIMSGITNIAKLIG